MTLLKVTLLIAALLALFAASGWRTVSDVTRDEETRWELKRQALENFKTDERLDRLEERVQKLEAR